MHRIPIHALVAAALLAWAPAAPAQEKAPVIGLGVDLVNAASVAYGHAAPLSIYVPVNLTGFRIEPSIGIFTESIEGGGSASRVELGVGGFVPVKSSHQLTVMAGGRLQLAFNSAKPPGGTSDSANDIYLAGALAGEWAAATHFSLGAEAQLGYYNNGSLGAAPSLSGFRTAGLVFARFYL
jgi:hypothetical protein